MSEHEKPEPIDPAKIPSIIILTRDESGVWIAESLAYTGLLSDGDTPKEALSNLIDACDVYFARSPPN